MNENIPALLVIAMGFPIYVEYIWSCEGIRADLESKMMHEYLQFLQYNSLRS